MADQTTDPKVQWQWQTTWTDENEENQVAFGGSEDFFDDPNFLDKIGQWNTNPMVEIENEEVNLWDISNIFDKKPVESKEEKPDEIENLDLSTSPVVEEDKLDIEPIVEEPIVESEKVKPEPVAEIDEKAEPVVEQVQIEETPKIEPKPITKEPVIEKSVIEEPVIEQKQIEDDDEDIVAEDETIEEEIIPEIDGVVPEVGSDFIKKFNELKKILSDVYEVKTKLGYEWTNFDVIWANSDRSKITYTFDLDEDETISIQKTELDKQTEEETEHTLFFRVEEEGLNVGMDDISLFEEKKDLEKDPKKKLQVMDKISKFIFLAGEYQNTIQMELREKLEEEQEKKKMQDIFRNF